jgi:4'-phosphopantetheinyl transferase
VWTVPCSDGAVVADDLRHALSEHERQRATRMTDASARAAFVIGRARVRQILAGYVAQPPAALDVVARASGKPVLAGAPAWFDFSFSRCARLHVCAVGVSRRLGIDVELVGSGRDASVIAATYFTEEERAWLATRDGRQRAAAFAALWVKKEAFVKALGTGLRLRLDAFHVPFGDEGWVLGPAPQGTGETQGVRWRARGFRPDVPGLEPDAVAAAVVAEGDWRLTPISWPGLSARSRQ